MSNQDNKQENVYDPMLDNKHEESEKEKVSNVESKSQTKQENVYDPMQDHKHEEKESEKEHESKENLEDMPQVDSEQKSKTVNKLFVAIAFFIGLVLLFGCAVLFANKYKENKAIERAEQQKMAEKKESANADAGRNIGEEKARAKLEADLLAQAQNDAMAGGASEPIVVADSNANYAVPTADNNANYVTNTAPQSPQYAVAQPSNANTEPSPLEVAKQRKLGGSVMAYEAGANAGTASTNNVSMMGGMSAGFAPEQNQQRNSFANQYASTAFSPTVAGQRKNLTMLLKQGTIIPCVLLTKIDSTYAGQASCQVAKDIYSANGKTLLIERGSKVIGEQRVQVGQGQARVFVLWSHLETPKGVQVQLDSGSTDSLGASGINARVNNHYLKRFGGAILISMIEDAVELLKDNGNQSGGVSYNSTSDSANEIAVEALKNTIGIPPTAHVHQGSLLNVFVSRDVDFQQVYKLVNRH